MDILSDLELKKQRLEEEVDKMTTAFEREEKLRKELEVLNSKLLAEKTQLLQSLEGEKGSVSSIQERAAKLAAQKSDLDSQLAVSVFGDHNIIIIRFTRCCRGLLVFGGFDSIETLLFNSAISGNSIPSFRFPSIVRRRDKNAFSILFRH